ncbi:MAG: hypothetical protein A2Z88_09615 [Omnitrophica WOR_2 bacterium GWA2_47_8]|nr:MAG: hypothetical protein A2Z88_09615 [Omnitrophica WOR_2 bacterium GWA2_47_8]
MRKTIIILTVALSFIAISSQSFAAQFDKSRGISYRMVEGTIVSINTEKNLFTVKCSECGKVYGFMARASDLASLNQGDSVTVTTERPGALALSIR